MQHKSTLHTYTRNDCATHRYGRYAALYVVTTRIFAKLGSIPGNGITSNFAVGHRAHKTSYPQAVHVVRRAVYLNSPWFRKWYLISAQSTIHMYIFILQHSARLKSRHYFTNLLAIYTVHSPLPMNLSSLSHRRLGGSQETHCMRQTSPIDEYGQPGRQSTTANSSRSSCWLRACSPDHSDTSISILACKHFFSVISVLCHNRASYQTIREH